MKSGRSGRQAGFGGKDGGSSHPSGREGPV